MLNDLTTRIYELEAIVLKCEDLIQQLQTDNAQLREQLAAKSSKKKRPKSQSKPSK